MLRLAGLLSGATVLILGLIGYRSQYARWQSCFNEQGRCFDPETGQVYLEQAGIGWGMLAALGAVLCAASLVAMRRARRP